MFWGLFKQRLRDVFIQEWSGTVQDWERYEHYRDFKTIFGKEKYVFHTSSYCFRVAITQLRFNELPLNNNICRYSTVNKEKMCPFCSNQIENEAHFLLRCPQYDDLRNKFIKEADHLPIEVLSTAENDTHRYKVSRFVFHAINKRQRVKLLMHWLDITPL